LKIEGSFMVDAPLHYVWPALLDPHVVAACIPGCSRIEIVSPTKYRGTINMKFGPIEPQFEVEVTLTNIVEKVSIASTTSGQEGSRASLLRSENLVLVRQASPESTEVSYCSTVSVSGRLGKFGLGLMKKTSEKLAVEFGLSLCAALKDHVSRAGTVSESGVRGGSVTNVEGSLSCDRFGGSVANGDPDDMDAQAETDDR
jgi:carbon monoxide dehydrogenase subunit G